MQLETEVFRDMEIGKQGKDIGVFVGCGPDVWGRPLSGGGECGGDNPAAAHLLRPTGSESAVHQFRRCVG